MTTDKIEDLIIKNLISRQFPIFLTHFAGRGFDEADVFGISRNGYMYEYEVKKNRADFFSEFKNKHFKHSKLQDRDGIRTYAKWKNGFETSEKIELIVIPNRYYIVCVADLIACYEIPSYAGLIYIRGTNLSEPKPAPLLHKNKANTIIYERVATILSQRMIFGCSYYTYLQKNKSK